MLEKIGFGETEFVVVLQGTFQRIPAFLAVEQRVGLRDAREGVLVLMRKLLLFAVVVAELDFLQSEHVELGLLEEVRFLVGVAHHPRLLVLQRFARN
jgi:hypothetical protein